MSFNIKIFEYWKRGEWNKKKIIKIKQLIK
jgi:hypothetical protein